MSVKRRIVALVACLAVALLMVPAVARAAEPEQGTYLALGDSITSGYGLSEGEKSFAEIVAEQRSLTLNDTYATDEGLTSTGLLAMFTNPNLIGDVKSASLISISIGGNDVMEALYAYLASAWNTANPESPLDVETLKTVLETGAMAEKLELLNFASEVLPEFLTSQEAQNALATFSSNFGQVVAAIKELNPGATLVVLNQYNPYSHLLSGLSQSGIEAILNPAEKVVAAFDEGAQALNAALSAGAVTGNYVVADTYTFFKSATENPCNASISLGGINLDFHPNAYGHALIAGAVDVALSPAAGFVDVDTGEWYFEYVNWAVTSGLLTGYDDGSNTFGPNNGLKRAEFGEILYRAFGATSGIVPDETKLDQFVDLEHGVWYSESMSWAVTAGIFKGYDDGTNRMGPGDDLSRGMVATVLMRVASLSGADVSARADLSSFADAGSVSTWAEDGLSWAVACGIFGGNDNGDGTFSLSPQDTCTRAEMSAILMRWLTLN